MSSFRRFFAALAFGLAMFVAPSLRAQAPQHAERTRNEQVAQPAQNTLLAIATEQTALQATAPAAGPTLTRATVGVRVAKAAPAKTPPRFAETRQNEAMMIVGGVALIVGAIIGDTPGTLIMVGGAGVGLYGLYKYLE